MLAGAFAGLAGPLYAFNNQWVAPENFSVNVSILSLVMIVVGGLSSNAGSVIGALFVVLVPVVLRAAIGSYASIEMLLWGLLIIVSLYYIPSGVAGVMKRSGDGAGSSSPRPLARWLPGRSGRSANTPAARAPK
jgi:branched-chain amino acid transport system permease protein